MLSIGVDGRVLHGPLTGTGWYTAGLLGALSHRTDVRIKLLIYPHDRRGRASTADFPGVEVVEAGRVGSRLPGLAARTGLHVGLDRLLPGCDAYLFPNYRRSPVSQGLSITVVYDLAFRRVPHLVNPAYLRSLRRSAEDAIRHSDLVVTPSAQIREEIVADYGRDRTSVIPVLPGPRHRAVVDHRATGRGHVLHVGTVEPRKDIETLIEAHSRLPKRLAQTFPLLLAGKAGWGSGGVLELARRHSGHVRWLGYIPDAELANIYESATVLVTASHYEGLGLPVLEALATGLPVLCSDIPAHRELCGQSAQFFPSGDADALQRALIELLSSPERLRHLTTEGLLRTQRFSWNASLDKLLNNMSVMCG
jgi:glycosyltransferase involved in cell wall biosynthesis